MPILFCFFFLRRRRRVAIETRTNNAPLFISTLNNFATQNCADAFRFITFWNDCLNWKRRLYSTCADMQRLWLPAGSISSNLFEHVWNTLHSTYCAYIKICAPPCLFLDSEIDIHFICRSTLFFFPRSIRQFRDWMCHWGMKRKKGKTTHIHTHREKMMPANSRCHSNRMGGHTKMGNIFSSFYLFLKDFSFFFQKFNWMLAQSSRRLLRLRKGGRDFLCSLFKSHHLSRFIIKYLNQTELVSWHFSKYHERASKKTWIFHSNSDRSYY